MSVDFRIVKPPSHIYSLYGSYFLHDTALLLDGRVGLRLRVINALHVVANLCSDVGRCSTFGRGAVARNDDYIDVYAGPPMTLSQVGSAYVQIGIKSSYETV